MKTYNFEKQITINGKRKIFRADSERALNRKIAAYKEEAASKKYFRTVSEEWKEEAYPNLEHNTLSAYNGSLNRILLTFANIDIAKVVPQDIDTYLKKTTLQGYSRHTVNNDRLILNLIFNYSVIKGYIDINPCTSVKTPKNAKKTKRKPASVEDRQKVMETADTPMGFFALFLMYTGLRLGEALALRGADIDFKNNVINVNKSLYWDGNDPKIKEPKTESGVRSVALLDVLKPYLSNIAKTKIVFSYHSKYFTKTVFQKHWNKYAKENGITSTPHCFRHLYATILYDAGIAPKDAQLILGHAQLSTTMDIYTDIEQARKLKTNEILNNYVHTKYTPNAKNP